jgi:hypothetical protein
VPTLALARQRRWDWHKWALRWSWFAATAQGEKRRNAKLRLKEDTSVVNFFGEPDRPSENQENDVVLKKRISRLHREEETVWFGQIFLTISKVSPNILEKSCQ